MISAASLTFTVPVGQVATAPPEARGAPRDGVKLLVASPRGLDHSLFERLEQHLRPGDLVVINSSPTMPAAVVARLRGRSAHVHFSTLADDGFWTVELRRQDQSGPITDAVAGEVVRLPRGWLRLDSPADGGQPGHVRLWRASTHVPGGVRALMHDFGQPIRYGYVPERWPLRYYQTIFSDQRVWPGSAEIPSAARPFTFALAARLRAMAVGMASVVLHAGVSSQESGELPQPERYAVGAGTAAMVNRTRRTGGRVIAVGTTVTRALESVAAADGTVAPSRGWTDLVLRAGDSTSVVDGLVTGWHPPEASHLGLLAAVAGRDLVTAAYAEAVEHDYLWHEFGDSCLLLRR